LKSSCRTDGVLALARESSFDGDVMRCVMTARVDDHELATLVNKRDNSDFRHRQNLACLEGVSVVHMQPKKALLLSKGSSPILEHY
jgi:hypothetical protein